jgi:hypothetical protein
VDDCGGIDAFSSRLNLYFRRPVYVVTETIKILGT